MKQTIENVLPSVIRRQYAKGMTLWQLAILYETDEASIQPIVEGIVQNLREDEDELDVGIAGAEKTERQPSRHHLDYAAYADRVKHMMDAGMSNAEMMDALDITHSNLQTIKKKFGLKLSYAHGGSRRVARQKRLNQTKEEPTMPDVTTASLESAVTAFKPEETPEVIGQIQSQQERTTRIEQRVLNRDKAVWGDYLSARSEEIEDVTHSVEVLVENGKLIERTTIAYTLERELGR